MHLDDLLNSRSIAHLQALQFIWAPTTRRSSSKQELLRLLRQQMLSPERLRECFQDLSEAHRDFLRALLRLEGYEGDVAFFASRLAHPPPSPQAEREIVRELSLRGFVTYTTSKSWNQVEAIHAVVPQELGDMLADALNLDTREAALMLSLRRYLEHLAPDARLELAGSGLDPGDLVAQLAQAEAVEARIAALPDPGLQRAVRMALDDRIGILPLERFPSLGLDIEAVDSPAWRATLERSLLGTFGHLSLLELGMGDDHECLVLYQEVVHGHAVAQGRADVAIDHAYSCGIDFITDLAGTVDFVRANPAKLTSATRFFKGTRNQLRPRTALHTTYFMDEESLVSYKLTVARELGLVEPGSDGRLYATRSSLDWEALPLPDQAQSVLGRMLELGETAASGHFAALAGAAARLLLDLSADAWLPTSAFLAAVLSRYLLTLVEQGAGRRDAAAPSAQASWGYPRRSDSLAGIAEAVREPLLQAVNYAGLVDIGRCGAQSFVRVGALAPMLCGARAPAEPGRLIIVNPDFEVVLFPEEGHAEILHRLSAFCEREKSEVTLHLRITQASIRLAVLRGLDPGEIIATLRDHCRVPLSQNIDYSIRTWAAGVHAAEVRTLNVLELHSAEVLDAVLRLPQIAPLVERRLSPTAAALKVARLDPEAEEALRELGIYLM